MVNTSWKLQMPVRIRHLYRAPGLFIRRRRKSSDTCLPSPIGISISPKTMIPFKFFVLKKKNFGLAPIWARSGCLRIYEKRLKKSVAISLLLHAIWKDGSKKISVTTRRISGRNSCKLHPLRKSEMV